jgi:hypothetical protein
VLAAAVQAATENYYVTLYGTPDGSGPFGAGTPAEAFSNALDAAYQSFGTAVQAAFQSYTSSMEGWDMQMMQYFMDEMMGMGGTPPDPDDPARFSKDYHVDVAARGVDLAAAHGAAWVAWVSAEVAAGTVREQEIINAQYDYGVTQANAGLQLAQQAIAAEDSAAKDIIDIDADFAIAQVAKEGEVAAQIADADLVRAQALNAAAETLALADNAASKTQADAIVAADETRANGVAAEEADLTKDLAAASETRENEVASAEANLINEEAAANVTATSIAASAATALAGGFMSAYTGYVATVAPLVTAAQQAFTAALHTEYVTATGGDPDQTAVSQGWTDYFNTMATAAASLMTGEAAAAAAAVNTEAAASEALANHEAAESQTLAATGAGAYTALVSAVAAAATSATNDLADAGLALAQSLNGAIAGFLNAATSAGKALADTSVTEGVALANSIAGLVNGFTHSYISAAVAFNQDVVEEGRTADKDADSALTGLASGVASEGHDLAIDSLDDGKHAALASVTLDDIVTIAQTVLDAAWSVLSSWFSLQATAAASLSDFAASTPAGGAAPAESTFLASAGGFLRGVGQGGLNIANGIQDSLIGLVNLPLAGVNGIAWLEEQAGILDSTPGQQVRIGYIPSPDWSRDVLVHEGGSGWTDTHNWSKGLGAFGVEVLAGTWWAKLKGASAAPRRAAHEIADEIRTSGHPIAASRRTIAVGEDAAGNLHVGSSNGLDRGMREAADRLGVNQVPSRPGLHAEEELMEAIDDLKRVGTSKRLPCGPGEHNCAQQLLDRGIEVTNLGG